MGKLIANGEINIEVLTRGIDIPLLAEMIDDFIFDQGVKCNTAYAREKLDNED